MAVHASSFGFRASRSITSAFRKEARAGSRSEALSLPALLENLGAEGYRVAHGVSTSRGKLDHVVIGPSGSFAIEVRDWAGKVGLTSGPRLVVGGRDEHATVRSTRAAANDVQSRLSRAGVVPWVEAILVLPENAEMSRGRMPIPSERVTVLRAQELVAFIREHTGSLSAGDVDRAAAAISSR